MPDGETLDIPTRAGAIRCIGGHGRLAWRAETMFTEEPQTIRWLDAIPAHAVLWDIGANVGLYSLYAAKVRSCHAVALEPESQNFALLCRNIALNGLDRLVRPAPIAVGASTGVEYFHVKEISSGIAWSTLGPVARDDHTFRQVAPCYRVDDLIRAGGDYWAPTHVKIDVDGTELDVIGGATEMIASRRVKSFLIELDSTIDTGKAIVRIMMNNGYVVASSERNASVKDPVANPSINYVFERD